MSAAFPMARAGGMFISIMGAGVVLGGVGGAVAGNAIAGSNDHPCPAGYYYGPPPPGPGPGGFWDGAPRSLHERYDFMQSRIDRAAQSGRIELRHRRVRKGRPPLAPGSN